MPITPFRMTEYNPDIAPHLLPDNAWSDLFNMVHRDGVYTTAGGTANLGTEIVSPAFLLPCEAPDGDNILKLENYWIWGGVNAVGTSKVYIRDAAGNKKDITHTAGTTLNNTERPDDWTGGIINGFPVLTVDSAKDGAAVSNIIYWPRTNAAANDPNVMLELPGQRVLYRVRSIAIHRNHIFGLSTVSTANGHVPEEVIWSDAAAVGAVPTTWVPAAGNEAGDVRLGDSPGEVIDGLSFGNRLLLYKREAAYSAEYIGGNAVFQFRKLSGQVGVMSRHCVVNYGQKQFILTPDDVVEFDGVQFRSIADRFIKRQLQTVIGAANTRDWSFFVGFNPRYAELTIYVPDSASDEAVTAWVYNAQSGKWGFRSFGGTWVGVGCHAYGWAADQALDATSDPLRTVHLGAPVAQRIYIPDKGGIIGTPFTWRCQRDDLDLGDPLRRKIIKRIWPRIYPASDTGTVVVALDARDNPHTTQSFTEFSTTFDPRTDEYVDITGINGRYISVKLTDADSDEQKVWGFDLEWEFDGAY
jgi:hypothetical protein